MCIRDRYSVVENVLVAETKEQKDINKQLKKLEVLKKRAQTINEREKFDEQINKLRKNTKLLVLGDSFDNPIYKNSMEWMLEFPEMLDEDGKFQGFDVVIGNPPYGVSIKDSYRKIVEAEYGKVPDYEIYYYFVEMSYSLLNTKGSLSFIIPNTFLFNTFALNYRINILNRWNIYELLDCSAFPIFDSATVRNAIIFYTMKNSDNFIGYRNTNNVKSFKDLIIKPKETITKQELLSMNQNWSLAFKLDNNIISIIQKIKKHSSLETFFPEISQGLIAYDKYRGQSPEVIENRVYHYSSYREGLKKWLWGEDVKRFCVHWNEKEYIDYCEGIANPRKPKFFKEKRLLVREITNPSIYAAVTSDELYNDPSVVIILDNNNSIYFLAAIMNSKLATFYHFNNSPKAVKGAFPKILVKDIKEFPLAWGDPVTNQKIADLAEEIQHLKQNNIDADTSKQEAEIDRLVYKLYNLTEEEIKIIEENV